MSTTVKLKRGSGSDPSASDMVVGEPVIRTDTAELFFKKDDGSVAKVSGGGGGPDFKYLALRNAANDGSASYPGNDFTLVTSGTTTAVSPAAANTLLVSYGGVIQKPNSGTSTSGITGFIVDGSRFKTATNLAAAPDFILYQESGGIGEPSDGTVTEAKLSVSNNPTNGYFLSAQSGNTGGLTWAAVDLSAYLPLAGGTITGSMAMTGSVFDFADSKQLRFGTNNDFSISHSSNTTLENDTTGGHLILNNKATLGSIRLRVNDGEEGLVVNPNGQVQVYCDNALKLNTHTSGVTVTGTCTADTISGLSGDHTLTSSGSNSTLSLNSTGTNSRVKLKASGSNGSIQMTAVADIKFYSGTDFQTQTFEAKSGGVDVYGNCLIRSGGELRLGDDDNSNRVGFKAPSTVSSDQIWTLPAADGSANTSLTTDGSGNLSWASASVGGSTGIDFNDNVKARFGAGNDLELFHDGSNSYIQEDGGAGQLILRAWAPEIQVGFDTTSGRSTGEKAFKAYTDAQVELYYDNSKKFETSSTGGILRGTMWTAVDNTKIAFGSSDDLVIFHDSANSYISKVNGGTGNLYIDSHNASLVLRSGDGSSSVETAIQCINNAQVELYHSGTKKLETDPNGIKFNDDFYVLDGNRGYFGTGNDLSIFHDGSHSRIKDTGTGYLILNTDTGVLIKNGADNEGIAYFTPNGSVELMYDNSKKLESTSYGIEIPDTLRLTTGFSDVGTQMCLGAESSGATYIAGYNVQIMTGNNYARVARFSFGHDNFSPLTTNAYDLGSTSLRWRNIYTNDLNLSNEGGSNDVDGTWGSYTIQEGAEDLFLVNKRSGKKYKFNLTEVS